MLLMESFGEFRAAGVDMWFSRCVSRCEGQASLANQIFPASMSTAMPTTTFLGQALGICTCMEAWCFASFFYGSALQHDSNQIIL